MHFLLFVVPVKSTDQLVNVLIVASPNTRIVEQVRATKLLPLLGKYLIPRCRYSIDTDKSFETEVLTTATLKTDKNGNVWFHKKTGGTMFMLHQDLVVRFRRQDTKQTMYYDVYRGEFAENAPMYQGMVYLDEIMGYTMKINAEKGDSPESQTRLHQVELPDKDRFAFLMAVKFSFSTFPNYHRACFYIPYNCSTSVSRFFGPTAEHLKRCLDADLAIIGDVSMLRWIAIRNMPLYTFGVFYDLLLDDLAECAYDHFTFSRRHVSELDELRFKTKGVDDPPIIILDGIRDPQTRSKKDQSRITLLMHCLTFMEKITISGHAPGDFPRS